MARSRYNVVPQGQINIVRPQSGVDMLLETVSQYADPNYQLNRKELALNRRELSLREKQIAADSRRADATLQLKRNEQELREKAFRKESILADNELAIKQSQEERAKETYLQGIKDNQYEQDLDQFNTIFNPIQETGNIDEISSFLGTYNTNNPRLTTHIEGQEKIVASKNEALNNQISALQTIAPGLTSKYENNMGALKTALFQNPGYIVDKMLEADIGKLTEGDEKQYQRDKDMLGMDIKMLGSLLPGSDEQLAALERIETSMNKMRGNYNPAKGIDFNAIDRIVIEGEDDASTTSSDNIQQQVPAPAPSPAEYIQLASTGEGSNIVGEQAEGESLGFLKSAAKEGSVLVPVTKEVSRAVQSSVSDIGKSVSKYRTNLSPSRWNRYGADISDEKTQKNLESAKNSIVNAINLYKSIDPKAGRGGKGGERERNKIKKSIMSVKNRYKNSKPSEFKTFLDSITFDTKKKDKGVLASTLDQLIKGGTASATPDSTVARPSDAPEDVPDWMFQPIVE